MPSKGVYGLQVEVISSNCQDPARSPSWHPQGLHVTDWLISKLQTGWKGKSLSFAGLTRRTLRLTVALPAPSEEAYHISPSVDSMKTTLETHQQPLTRLYACEDAEWEGDWHGGRKMRLSDSTDPLAQRPCARNFQV
jgi:hypothetical protein